MKLLSHYTSTSPGVYPSSLLSHSDHILGSNPIITRNLRHTIAYIDVDHVGVYGKSEVREDVGRVYKVSVEGVGKCVGVWGGDMGRGVGKGRGRCGKVCWGLGGGEGRCERRCVGVPHTSFHTSPHLPLPTPHLHTPTHLLSSLNTSYTFTHISPHLNPHPKRLPQNWESGWCVEVWCDKSFT